MKTDKMTIEKRLENMKNFYIRTEERLDNLPETIPDKTRVFLKDTILGDKELKQLIGYLYPSDTSVLAGCLDCFPERKRSIFGCSKRVYFQRGRYRGHRIWVTTRGTAGDEIYKCCLAWCRFSRKCRNSQFWN